MQRCRLLFIDDDLGIARAYRRTFERDHDIVVVGTEHEASTVLASDSRFDIVVCDILLPDGTGLDVYHRVERVDPALAARFVFATGGVADAAVAQALDKLESRVLVKPFRMQILKDLIAVVQAGKH